MKSSFSNVLFLIFAITTQSILFTKTHTATGAEVVVKDTTGKKVLNNVRYGIGPVISGGHIKLTDTDNKKKVCPFNVVQDPKDNIGGEFMFTMLSDSTEKYLKTLRVLGIDSGVFKGACTKSTFWKINDSEKKAPENLITTGGEFETEPTCFQVLKHPKPTNAKVNSYMLQHCPNFCGGPLPKTCYNVSTYEYNGVKRLASAGSTPFEFVFYKLSK